MLPASQWEHLEAVVHRVSAELHIEEATLDAQQTLEVVLCRDPVCFRPLRVTMADVNISAALAGDAVAQQALQAWLQAALRGML